jgi:hypothetical protein
MLPLKGASCERIPYLALDMKFLLNIQLTITEYYAKAILHAPLTSSCGPIFDCLTFLLLN